MAFDKIVTPIRIGILSAYIIIKKMPYSIIKTSTILNTIIPKRTIKAQTNDTCSMSL